MTKNRPALRQQQTKREPSQEYAAIAAKLQQAVAHHQRGQLAQAESLYRAILAQVPTHFDALHFMGGMQYQKGQYQAAVDSLQKAIGTNPSQAAAHSNLGLALEKLNKLEQALASYDRALSLNPDFAEALYNRGNVLLDLRRPEDALASYDHALSLKPDFAEGLNNRGNVLLQLKRHEDALASYDRALAIKPNYAEALTNRGNVQRDLKRHEDTLARVDSALALEPDSAEALYNRGNALSYLKRHQDALASYERALSIKPDYIEALNNRGNALLDLERPEEALASVDHALSLKPDFADALNNRGNALLALQRPEDALASYNRALSLKPDFADALNNRGNALLALQQHQDALASYECALSLKPEYAEALYNRGNIQRDLQRPEEALTSYDHALSLKPDYIEALNNRGNALLDLKRPEDALASYDSALSLKPDFATALNNRGNALLALKRPDDALASLDRALAFKPDFPEAFNNRGNALRDLKRYGEAAESFAQLITLAPNYDYAVGNLLTCQLACCDWANVPHLIMHITNAVERGERAMVPFAFLATSQLLAAQSQCSRSHIADKYPASRTLMCTGERYQHDKIRVAYLSADFHDHATAYLMAELFEAHDKQRFEITAISFGPDAKGDMRGRLQHSFNQFVDVRRTSDRAVAHILRAREIDIVVDLKGFTNDCRTGILSHRPAPIQVNYLGYPGTMGADYIDYILADLHVIPPEQEAFYTEKVVYLPDTYQVNDSKRRIAERTPTRAEVGLPDTGFVFCCFNNNYKILPDIFDIWMRLLSKVTGSVLWLLEDNPAASHNLRREAEQRAVAPQRLVFAPRMKLDEHLARHRLADLFLDTLPYNAHTTASDALWAGLPVLTCMGSAFAGRVAGSLLNAVGLPQLITRSVEDYEALALKLATTPTMLSEIRAKLAQNRTTYPLFDTERFRRHIESAYITMWERYQRGEPPASFAVHPIQLT